MIFLKDNVLLERDITPDDIKPRLLGHWGTCPGLSLVYAHINRLIVKHNVDMLYVVGPGTCHPVPPAPPHFSAADNRVLTLSVFFFSLEEKACE